MKRLRLFDRGSITCSIPSLWFYLKLGNIRPGRTGRPLTCNCIEAERNPEVHKS
jgi:hypothetical protein